MKKIYLFTFVVFLSYHATIGQITTMEEPVSFRLRSDLPTLTRSERTMKSFAALDMERIEREDAEDERNGLPPRFGYPHQVNYNLDNSGEWVTLPDGDRIWRLTISCQGAQSINLLYDRFWIPDGAKFFVYSNDRSQIIGAVTSANNRGDRHNIQGFATGLVFSDQITLEYYLPSDIKETGEISISTVAHGYMPLSNMSRNFGNSGFCQVNVNCSEGNNWQNEKNAVAMILINGIRRCSGALINTTANNGEPLFLTADHCLVGGDAINAPNLNHWTFYWHYESPTCTNPDAEPPIRSTVGATVVANNNASDFALLRLTVDPRSVPGVIPYYLGWDRSGNSGRGGVGIHHPLGDLKKIATYNQIPQSHYALAEEASTDNLWTLSWIPTSNGHSIIRSGSSGSPLINNNRRIIGQQWAVFTQNCSRPADQIAYYGKFNLSWTGDNSNNPRRRLRDWLDSLNTNAMVLDGCSGVTNFTNQTVNTNTTVTNTCGNVNVNNTTVTPRGTLKIRATNAVNIGDGFTVQSGGRLNINVGP